MHFNGGDASLDRENTEPWALLDELHNDNVDLQDAKWCTPVGAEVLQVWMLQGLSAAGAGMADYNGESEDDECDDEHAEEHVGDTEPYYNAPHQVTATAL